jgi:hypothetical protein
MAERSWYMAYVASHCASPCVVDLNAHRSSCQGFCFTEEIFRVRFPSPWRERGQGDKVAFQAERASYLALRQRRRHMGLVDWAGMFHSQDGRGHCPLFTTTMTYIPPWHDPLDLSGSGMHRTSIVPRLISEAGLDQRRSRACIAGRTEEAQRD